MEPTTVETPTSKIEIQTSKQFRLNWRDLAETFLYAFLAALTSGLIQFLEAAMKTGDAFQLPKLQDLQMIGYAAMVVALVTLGRKLIAPSQTIVTETKK